MQTMYWTCGLFLTVSMFFAADVIDVLHQRNGVLSARVNELETQLAETLLTAEHLEAKCRVKLGSWLMQCDRVVPPWTPSLALNPFIDCLHVDDVQYCRDSSTNWSGQPRAYVAVLYDICTLSPETANSTCTEQWWGTSCLELSEEARKAEWVDIVAWNNKYL